MRKILVLRGGALGDFIVTLPALALLRQRWPAARIELVGNAVAAGLAKNRGLLDAVHSQHEARWSALFGDTPLPAEFAGWLGEFDLIVNYWPDPDGDLRRRFPIRSGQRFLSANAMPNHAPAATHYCEPLRELGLETGEYFFRLRTENNAGLSSPHSIAIHPGSGSSKKNWPIERWHELIASLAPSPILLILGEAELERWSPLAAGGLGVHVRIATNLPLESLIAELTHCRLFLGHDSGVSHLAAACGARSILLFGPTDPAMWAPPAPHVSVLRRGPDLSAISVAEVLSAIEASA